MTHTRGLGMRPLAALVVLILTGAGILACLPNAYAIGKDTILILNDVTPGTNSTSVSGVFTDEGGAPLGNFELAVSVNGKTVGTAITDTSGHFTFSFSNPAPGDHSVVVLWPGNTPYLRSTASLPFHIAQVAKLKTSLTAAADPATTHPGATITVSGALTSETGLGVNLARVTVTVAWADLAQMTITGEDGKYDIVFTIPSKAEFPSSVDILVEYKGDNVYEASSVTAKLGLAPTPTPTPSDSATTSSPPTPTATTSATPTLAPATVPDSPSQTLQDNPNLMLALTITAGVAVAAILTLLIIAIISNRRHRLADDERRGFGSDFGLKQR